MASSSMQALISQTNFSGLRLRGRGKVRDIYELDDGLLLIVATDRLSAFDVVLPTPIPDKGLVLTQLSVFWFDFLEDVVKNHLIASKYFPPELTPFAEELRGRAMLVRETIPVPVECIVRGYISGSGWKEYQKLGSVSGVPLPSGLLESDRLPEPIFTPSTKAATGHDENISFDQVVSEIGRPLAERLRDVSLTLYRRAAEHASARGIIIADTKFEFGTLGEDLVWIDEALTPDSSRFWPADRYEPGHAQPSFDKQYVRDYLERIAWNKQPPAPTLPPDVVAGTQEKYREAYQRITGHALD
ncbi:MAG TPA: phosphoribosylaminoimidazolesuccinocarboxamide synthase [Candidatus Acidoferrales bacterium]|nr:phosphoribosylaminoimidazolesuccinocarboxamide synthase [Candidatus Acidoferrales bacterium]